MLTIALKYTCSEAAGKSQGKHLHRRAVSVTSLKLDSSA